MNTTNTKSKANFGLESVLAIGGIYDGKKLILPESRNLQKITAPSGANYRRITILGTDLFVQIEPTIFKPNQYKSYALGRLIFEYLMKDGESIRIVK